MSYNIYNFKILSVSIFIIFVFISLFIRLKYISSVLTPNNIGHIYTITTIKSWDKNGGLKNYFVPIISYNNQGDKNITVYKRLTNKNGQNYFISFPPFSFIFAYIFHKIVFNINLNYLLTVLAILSHLLTTLLILLTLNKLYPITNSIENVLSNISSAFIILFSAPFLFHSLSWFPEIAVLPIWSWFIYFTTMIKTQLRVKKINFILGFIISFLLCYTDWLGYLVILSFYIYVFFINKNKILSKICFYCLLGSFTALLLTIIQYSQIDGSQSFIKALSIRFIERSGLFTTQLTDKGLNWYNINTWVLALKRFSQLVSGVGYLAVFLIIIGFLYKTTRITKYSVIVFLLFVSFLPVLLHFALLLNANVIHAGSWAKLYIPLSLGSAWSINIFYNKFDENFEKKYILTGLTAGIILSILVSSAHFKRIMSNYTDEKVLKEQALFIKSHTKNTQAVFIKEDDATITNYLPYIEFITERNIGTANNYCEVLQKMKVAKQKEAVFFQLKTNKYQILKIDSLY